MLCFTQKNGSSLLILKKGFCFFSCFGLLVLYVFLWVSHSSDLGFIAAKSHFNFYSTGFYLLLR